MLHKYFYLGYISPSVPKPWISIVEEMIEKIDKKARSKYMPRFILNWITYLAVGNSIHYIKNKFWYWVLLKINWGITIYNIKDKYGKLKVYGSFSDETYKIIEWAQKECEKNIITYENNL